MFLSRSRRPYELWPQVILEYRNFEAPQVILIHGLLYNLIEDLKQKVDKICRKMVFFDNQGHSHFGH